MVTIINSRKEERQILQFKEFKLEDKPLIDAYFAEHHYESSDHSFTTLYMWQYAYGISWAEENNVLYIRGGGKTQPFLLPPFAKDDGDFVAGLDVAKEWFRENNLPFMFRGVSPEVKERMIKLCENCYDFEPDRDNFEYIYSTEAMLSLAGKKLREKRNHLNQFRMQYAGYEYEPISAANMDECREVAKKWADNHEEAEEELEAISRLFDHWDALKLKGGVIRIFGHVEAFTIGEELNDRMSLVHIEKANPEIRGLYQAINNEFLRNTFSHLEFVNREEDMGMPGLRQAKESYQPVKFAEKFTATYREDAPCEDGCCPVKE